MNIRSVIAFLATALILAVCYGSGLHWSPWVFASAAVTALMLLIARLNMIPTPPAAAIAIVTLLYWGLSSVSNLIEAAYYQVISTHEALRDAPGALLFAIVAACVLEWLVPKSAASPARLVTLKAGQWWRIPLLCVAFFVIYFIAGLFVYPFVKAFYAGKPLPNLLSLSLLQLGRGLLDTTCFYPWLLRANGSRARIGAVSAGIFVILCSWGPLLLPNPYLPGPIRFAHSLEMGASGIAFGFLAAWLLLRRTQAEPSANPATSNPQSTLTPGFTGS
jgi:hypothetical protein